MHDIIVELRISADECLRLYRGEVQNVLARARDGRSVRFPASVLRRFVQRDGIQGSFRICYGSDGRLKDIQRI